MKSLCSCLCDIYVNDVFHFEQRLLYSSWDARGMVERISDDAISKNR